MPINFFASVQLSPRQASGYYAGLTRPADGRKKLLSGYATSSGELNPLSIKTCSLLTGLPILFFFLRRQQLGVIFARVITIVPDFKLPQQTLCQHDHILKFTFPDDDHLPAKRRQLRPDFSITCNVFCELRIPEGKISLRTAGQLATLVPMPKTTMHKYHRTPSCQHDIRLAADVADFGGVEEIRRRVPDDPNANLVAFFLLIANC